MNITRFIGPLYKLGFKHDLPSPNRIMVATGNIPVPDNFRNKLFLANWDYLEYIDSHVEDLLVGISLASTGKTLTEEEQSLITEINRILKEEI